MRKTAITETSLHLASKKFFFLYFVIEPRSTRSLPLAPRLRSWYSIRINLINRRGTRTHGIDVPTLLPLNVTSPHELNCSLLPQAMDSSSFYTHYLKHLPDLTTLQWCG